MKALLKFLWIQLNMDLREKGTLMNYYVIPLLFYIIIGSVFTQPETKSTLAATMIIFAVTMGAIVGIPGPLVKMRESGTLRAFSVNGISNGMVTFVHAISAFFHILIVSVIIFCTSHLIFKSDNPTYPVRFICVLLLFLLTSTAIGVLIGTFARNQSFVTTFSQLVFLPSILLSGIMFNTSMLPKVLMWGGRIFPATHAMQMFKGLAFHKQTNYSSMIALFVLTVIGVAAVMLTYLKIWKISSGELS
ncbi:ABC transporter permease [Lacrimispora algidixylanolytica]|uniref:Transport permease protein n=1 Tax=Lacrimispora algidixylanolytica TaxID=94868 RepID=A0A419T2F2_9FIRM|nr:ABC transporter permease [Lacrimispora algidixylanolytica]RKD31626.1 ABC transporter [Lacrimispora algidixylanolytica]